MSNRLRVLVTGSRAWSDEKAIREGLEFAAIIAQANCMDGLTVIHGGCSGADTIADKIARESGFEVEVHPADWKRHGKAAGPIRNAQMVQSGVDLCLAFPKGASRGTRGCMSLVESASITMLVTEEKELDPPAMPSGTPTAQRRRHDPQVS